MADKEINPVHPEFIADFTNTRTPESLWSNRFRLIPVPHNSGSRYRRASDPTQLIAKCKEILTIFLQALVFLVIIFLSSLLLQTGSAEASPIRWDAGFQTWPAGESNQTFTNVNDTGIDVRITFNVSPGEFGTFPGTGNPENTNFVRPSGPSPDTTNSLFIGLAGSSGLPAGAVGSVLVDIEYFFTGSTTRALVTNASYILHDVDVSTTSAWRDVIETAGYVGGRVGPELGGTPVLGIQDTTPAPTFTPTPPPTPPPTPTRFNQLLSNVNGRLTFAGVTGDSNREAPDDQGNIQVSFTDAVDTISFIFRNDPTTNRSAHGISLGIISFTSPPINPVIGVSKRLSEIRLESTVFFGDNTARASYDIVVRNLGNESLNLVQITETLDDVFGAGNFEVNNLTRTDGAGTVAPNANFDGSGDPNLLAGGGILAVGAEATFRLIIDINTASDTLPNQPFLNQVGATGRGEISDQNTFDLSNDVGSVPAGTDPIDPNGNGNPNEPEENNLTPLSFSLTPDIRLVKRITAVTRNGAPIAIAGINTFNDQAGDNNDNQLRQLSNGNLPLGVFTIPFGEVEDGDVLEYTIYFWNNGLQAANDLQLCDEVQNPAQLNSASLLLAPSSSFPNLAPFGTSADLSARGAGTPLESSCRSAPGTFPSGGGVVLGGTGFNLPAREVGAVQFRVTLP